jgi:HlyD family secretion protein
VQRVELESGDSVRANETILATFVPGDPELLDVRARSQAAARIKAAEAALGRARSERERARQELTFAVSELERNRDLAADGIVSQKILDDAELRERTAREALDVADFDVRAREHDLEVARAALVEAGYGVSGRNTGRAIHLRSPVDGVVLRVLRESESVVRAGEPIIEVADAEELEIISDFLSTDAVRIRPGHRVFVEEWGGDCPLQGRVRRIEPSGFTKISALGVEEQRVNVIIVLDDPREAWMHLGDGYRVEVRVITWESGQALKVPTSSLFRNGQDWAVFAVENGKAALRRVRVGRRNGNEAEVIDGLHEGEEVITYPSDAIKDGVAVEQNSVGSLTAEVQRA